VAGTGHDVPGKGGKMMAKRPRKISELHIALSVLYTFVSVIKNVVVSGSRSQEKS
jgi:hypothetical protein